MYRIWMEMTIDGNVEHSVSAQQYVRKGNAERVARRDAARLTIQGMPTTYTVSEKNPWKGDA